MRSFALLRRTAEGFRVTTLACQNFCVRLIVRTCVVVLYDHNDVHMGE